MRDWWKETENCFRPCHECGEKIEANEERYIAKNEGDIVPVFYHLDCGKEKQKEVDKKTREKLKQYTNEVGKIRQKEPNQLTSEDYKNIKSLQKELAEFSKQNLEDVWNTVNIKLLKTSLQELEKGFSERIKLKGNWKKGEYCPHKNIYWRSNETAYCLNCGEDEDKEFINSLCLLHQKNISDWTEKHKLSILNSFKIASKLYYETFTTQGQLKQIYQQAVEELNDYAKSKNISLFEPNDTHTHTERERERERAKMNELNQL